MRPKAGLAALTGAGSPAVGGWPGTREEGRGGLGPGRWGWRLGGAGGAQGRGVREAGRRAVLGAGRSVCAVPGVSSGLRRPRSPPGPTAPSGSEGPGPWCRGLGVKAALAPVSSLTPSASSQAAPSSRLPSAGLDLWEAGVQGRAPALPELAPLGQCVCGSDLGVHRPLLRSGLPHV